MSQRPKAHDSQRTPEDPLHKFYKSRESRKRPPNVNGREPIYNFDEWSRNHYGEAMRKTQDIRQRKAFYDKRREEEKDTKDFEISLYGLIFGGFVCMILKECYHASLEKPKKTYTPADN